jgi:hypothetical protein
VIQILITDRNLVPVGDPLTTWQSLDIVGRFNEPGSGSFNTAATPQVLEQLQPGNRVLIIRDGVEFIAGPIEKPGPYQWSIEDGENAGYGSIGVSFAEDDALIASRVSYPDPTVAATAQTVVDYYTATAVNAEVVMRDLVNRNAGPGALVARRIPHLALGSLASVGSNVTITSRWEALGDLLRRVALAGGGLGYRTRQSGSQILFEVFQPTDKSRQIRFSRGLGNLRSVTYEPEAPSATAVIVGGQGDLSARVIREVVDSAGVASWWRLEKFLDQTQTDVTAELDQAGTDALTENGESVRLATVTVDTPTQRYGQHYGLGDLVSVEYIPGVEQAQVVRQFHLQASPDSGELVTVLIGSQDASRDPAIVRLGHDLDRRLSRLERR